MLLPYCVCVYLLDCVFHHSHHCVSAGCKPNCSMCLAKAGLLPFLFKAGPLLFLSLKRNEGMLHGLVMKVALRSLNPKP